MSTDSTEAPIDINQARAASAEIPDAAEIQGANQYYGAKQAALRAAFEVVAPFHEQAPQLANIYAEIIRYEELAAMYMDRLAFAIRNPELLSTGEDDASTQG